jgi:hypothetical protein
VEDLVGRWQFYVDSASRTVVIELLRDGSFAETIIANQGSVQRCPGGTWRLECSLVQLDGYVTTVGDESRSYTWRVIDARGGFALYCGDGPDAQTFFCVRREQ